MEMKIKQRSIKGITMVNQCEGNYLVTIIAY